MPSAVTMETREASMPTERSMPPDIMTIVMPTATIPGTPTCCRIFRRLTGLMKVGYLPPGDDELKQCDDDDEPAKIAVP